MAKHEKCWKLLNDMIGRKSSKKGMIKVDNNEERIKNSSIILEIFSVEQISMKLIHLNLKLYLKEH